MVRQLRAISRILLPLSVSTAAVVALPACGGGQKAPKDPVVKDTGKKKPPPPPETEEDREKKRVAAAHKMVPEGTNCLPDVLREEKAVRFDLGVVNTEAVLCAVDTEPERLLGPIACWKINLKSGDLAYQAPAPMNGRGFPAKIDGGCARGYCLPKDVKATAKAAYLAWSPDGAKVAMHVGDDIHLFEAAGKARESSFTIRGEKGVTGEPARLFWVKDTIFVEAAPEAGVSPVWAFKAADGAAMGAIEAIGKTPKPLSTHGGAFVVLDEGRVAISEQGLTSLVTYEVATGKRAKVVRKLPKTPCKAEETEAYWAGTADKVPAKCKEYMDKTFAHLVGADAFAGTKNLVMMLREPRLGYLAVIDPKTLVESNAIPLTWCSDQEGAEKSEKSEKSE